MVRAIDLLMILAAVWGAGIGIVSGASFGWFGCVLGFFVGVLGGPLYVGFANVMFETCMDRAVAAFQSQRKLIGTVWSGLCLVPVAALYLGITLPLMLM